MARYEIIDRKTGEVIECDFRSSVGFVFADRDREKGGGPLITVPDEAMSIREILEKFTEGIDMAVEKQAVYGEEDADFDLGIDLEKVNQLDLFDRQELAREYGEMLQRKVADHNAAVLARGAAQEEAARNADRFDKVGDEEEREKPGKVSRKSQSRKYEDEDYDDDLPVKGKKK